MRMASRKLRNASRLSSWRVVSMRTTGGRKALAAAFDAGRDEATGDDRGLEQAEVVLGEVEDVSERGDVCRGAQVHRGQAQDRFVDDAEKRIGPGPSYSSRRYSRFSMPILDVSVAELVYGNLRLHLRSRSADRRLELSGALTSGRVCCRR